MNKFGHQAAEEDHEQHAEHHSADHNKHHAAYTYGRQDGVEAEHKVNNDDLQDNGIKRVLAPGVALYLVLFGIDLFHDLLPGFDEQENAAADQDQAFAAHPISPYIKKSIFKAGDPAHKKQQHRANDQGQQKAYGTGPLLL